jgi:hypothetical protein
LKFGWVIELRTSTVSIKAVQVIGSISGVLRIRVGFSLDPDPGFFINTNSGILHAVHASLLLGSPNQRREWTLSRSSLTKSGEKSTYSLKVGTQDLDFFWLRF